MSLKKSGACLGSPAATVKVSLDPCDAFVVGLPIARTEGSR